MEPQDHPLQCTRFRVGIDEKSAIHPIVFSLSIAAFYVVATLLYIWISGRLVADASSSVEVLAHLELMKGLVFITVTGILLFAATFFMLHKCKLKDEIIISKNKSLIASERLVTAGVFSSSVCHDINNLIYVITGNAELLRKTGNLDTNGQQHIDRMLEGAERMSQLAKKMMDAGKDCLPGQKAQVDLVQLIKELVDFAKIHKKMKRCAIHFELPEKMCVGINASLFNRAIMNLLLNASDAMNYSGDILVRLTEEDGGIAVEVHDSGTGIPNEMKQKIFEPFYTTKDDGSGLGLLSLKIFAEQHNARVKLGTSKLGGACFSLVLPKEELADCSS